MNLITEIQKEYTHRNPDFNDTLRGYCECLGRIELQLRKKPASIISIEGCCGSGKSTLAEAAAELFQGSIVHMDDYYLPFGQRADGWLYIPGGNMDFARFNHEISVPLATGAEAISRIYDCKNNRFTGEKKITAGRLVIVEGSYSRHPLIALRYDLSIYLRCSSETMAKRLQSREKDNYSGFIEKWIPAEQRYNELYSIEQCSTVHVFTD